MADVTSFRFTYILTDFFAVEEFNNPEDNLYTPELGFGSKGHGIMLRNIEDIDSSLNGCSAKDALDFLAQHNGKYIKPTSKVCAVYGRYMRILSSCGDCIPIKDPSEIDLPFEKYVSLGKLEKLPSTYWEKV